MSQTLPAATKPLLVHIDMKGGPPTPRYLIQLLSLFKTWGASGILIEWEDMFPWDGELQVNKIIEKPLLGILFRSLFIAKPFILIVCPVLLASFISFFFFVN